ncbi:MAG: YceI family protein [Bdellovibrio sp.]|nr:YceI family protein [Bdellovibrio sp.]
MKFYFAFIFLLLSLSIRAKEITVTSSNYKEAMTKSNFIKFDMESTKLGFVTTGFTGVAKQFRISFDEQNNTLSKILVVVPVKQMDTDSNGRNEKMWETSLGEPQYPEIKVDLPGPVPLQEGVSTVEGHVQIRGLFYPIKLKLELKKREGGMTVLGTSELSISGTKIPDPSIMIAKVRDRIDLSFQLDI